MENSCLLFVNIENQGNTVKYYIGNTFIDPTHCRFRYTKIVYNKEQITYHVREAVYLADQANIEQIKQKKEL